MAARFSKRIITYSLTAVIAFSNTACSIDDVSYYFKTETEKQEYLYKSPRFLDDASQIKGYSNLSILHNVAFEGKPYNDIRNFGNRILMVGQGNYNTSIIDDQKTTIQYSFDVYDPWKNDIVASLSHNDISCDSYEIVGNELWLISSSAKKISVYDGNLNYIRSEAYSSLDKLVKSPESFDDFYTPLLCGASNDKSISLVSGINKQNYKYQVASVNSKTGEIISQYNGQSFSFSAVSENGFAIKTDPDNNIWTFHKADNLDFYFSLDNVRNITISDSSTLLIRQDYSSNSLSKGNQTISGINLSSENGVISSFSYDLKKFAADTDTFCSNHTVYLPQCNRVMYLLYTSECNPEILIWDLNKTTSGKNPDITVYDSYDSIKAAMTDAGTFNSGYSDDFGDTETNIPDPASYDWGDLADVNSRADALEEKYGISIYLGPEVPDKIDCYDITADTSHDDISKSLDILETIFACYPDNFFSQLQYGDICGIRIYLAGSLDSDAAGTIQEASGFVTNINGYAVMALDSNYLSEWGYTVNHEISHMIDQRLDFMSKYNSDCTFSENIWSSYNPDDFSYLNSYDNYENSKLYRKYSNYFIDSYGITYSTEDRAEIFGTVLEDYINNNTDDPNFESGSPLYYKIDYYRQCIRDNFDTAGWPDKLPWEMIFN